MRKVNLFLHSKLKNTCSLKGRSPPKILIFEMIYYFTNCKIKKQNIPEVGKKLTVFNLMIQEPFLAGPGKFFALFMVLRATHDDF